MIRALFSVLSYVTLAAALFCCIFGIKKKNKLDRSVRVKLLLLTYLFLGITILITLVRRSV